MQVDKYKFYNTLKALQGLFKDTGYNGLSRIGYARESYVILMEQTNCVRLSRNSSISIPW